MFPHWKTVLLACACVSLAACNQSPSSKTVQPPAVQPPTATEAFDLRSRCADLAEKLMENNAVGSELTENETSHYEPRTNRCYVELTIQSADQAVPTAYLNRILYDGQTHDTLAVATITNGRKTGTIYVPNAPSFDNAFDSADAFIDTMMADDRKE